MSDQGGERAAAALTVLSTAILQGVEPLTYLTGVLRAIDRGHKSSRIEELLPVAWAKQHGQQIFAQKPFVTKLAE
jgi:transposase